MPFYIFYISFYVLMFFCLKKKRNIYMTEMYFIALDVYQGDANMHLYT